MAFFNHARRIAIIVALIIAVLISATQAFAAATGSHTPVDGVTVGVSGATDNSMSNGAVTVTAKGSAGFLGIGASAKTATITVYNESGLKATLSFDWTATSVNQLVIDGTTYSGASGSFSKVMDPGTNFTITITTAKNGTTNKLVMSSFSVVEAAESSDVTINFNSALGSVTAEGAAVTSGDTQEVSLAEGVDLVATPSSGATFLAWINTADNSVVSYAASFTCKPSADISLKAVFTNAASAPMFWANGTALLYESFDAAISYASSASNKVITLASDATLAAGNYTIPAGVTLNIPYNAAHTLCTTEPTITETNSTPSVYRMLTMASGANITVNGAISVSGQQYCSRPIGAISGQYGVIEMADGSSITVEDGGNLYAWGYIAGVKGSDNSVSEGNITIKSGGTVYEDFQVVDWRGGTATSSMINNGNKVFPMSQYYVQNVQVPMTFETGATEKTFTSVSVTLAGIQSAPITFIGNGGMFILGEDASVVKDYDETTDRLILTLEQGSITLGSVYMELKISTLGGKVVINSANYVLPLNNNITIIARSNTVLNAGNDIAMLPGSKMILEEGSNLNITSGSFYIYDLDEWTYDTASEAMTTKLNGNASNNGGYTSEFNYIMMAATYTHDRIKTRTTADLEDANVEINGVITVSEGAYVYTTASGANVYSTGNGKIVFKGAVGTATKTYQALATGSKRTGVAYCDIPITSAKLKNGDGSYVETSSATSVTTYTYCPACLEWEYDGTGSVNHATNVELGNGLNMYFAFWNDTPLDDWGDSYYVEIIHTDAFGDIVKSDKLGKTLWLRTTVNDTTEAWVVYYEDLSAKQMGDKITIKLYHKVADEEGNVIDVLVDEWSNSIQHYAMRMLKKYETDTNKGTLRTLLVDMLNYGAACQKEFNYDTGNLVNAGLSAVQQGWATKTVTLNATSNENPNFQANLIVDGNIQFAVSGVNDLSSYSFTNHWKVPRDGQEFKSADGYYYISKLYVADARQVITITVNGTTFTDSIESYCKRMIDKGEDTNEVFTSFMKFSDAARAYLHDEVNRV